MASQDSTGMARSITLNDGMIKKFQVYKNYGEPNKPDPINSIDFSHDGEQMVTSSNDDLIFIHDCNTPTTPRMLNSKKYGVSQIRLLEHHGPGSAIHASNKKGISNAIRFLSLAENKYMRYFYGHQGPVVNLSLSKKYKPELFLSTSEDKTIRLWDLRNPNCLSILKAPNIRPIASFDQQGAVFGVGFDSRTVKLFDIRNHAKGPFLDFDLYKAESLKPTGDWSNIKFSRDGKWILITTFGADILILDAFTCHLVKTLKGFKNSLKLPLEASFTPDSKYVMSGSDGEVCIWNLSTLNPNVPLAKLTHEEILESEPVNCVQMNPKYSVIASATKQCTLWIPSSLE